LLEPARRQNLQRAQKRRIIGWKDLLESSNRPQRHSLGIRQAAGIQEAGRDIVRNQSCADWVSAIKIRESRGQQSFDLPRTSLRDSLHRLLIQPGALCAERCGFSGRLRLG
jgi:hypothetical protein